MPVDGQAMFKAAVMLAEVEEMRVTVKNTFASSAITALAGTGGFLLLGPAGLFIGSTVAGLGVYNHSKNKFKPVFAILKEDLRPQQQQELINLLRVAFADVHYTDAMKILALLMNKDEMWVTMRNVVMTYVLEYFMTGMSMNNVNVEVKKMTESERHQKFTEEFKRLNGLTGEWCPPAIKAKDAGANNGSESAAAPGWRPDLAASTADAVQRPAEAAAAPSLLQTPTAETSAHHDESPPSEEQMHPPSVSKTTLKTTF